MSQTFTLELGDKEGPHKFTSASASASQEGQFIPDNREKNDSNIGSLVPAYRSSNSSCDGEHKKVSIWL